MRTKRVYSKHTDEHKLDNLPNLALSNHNSQPLEDMIKKIDLVGGNQFRQVFNLLPLAIVIVTTIRVFAEWYAIKTLSLPYITSGLALVFSFLITRDLFLQFPQALAAVWKRQLLAPRIREAKSGGIDVRTHLQNFSEMAERQVESKLGLLFGLVGIGIVIWLLATFEFDKIARGLSNFQNDMFAVTVSMIIRLVYLLGGFIGGLIAWRVIIIARGIRSLGNDLDLNLQVEHPDGCGGLRPLGDTCLAMALILFPFMVLAGGWLIFINMSSTNSSAANMGSVLQTLVIPLALLSLIMFFQPLTSLHNAMLRAKTRLQGDLDLVSQEIDHLSIELRLNAKHLSPDEALAKEKKIEFLYRLYERNNRIPTWPIRYEHLWRLATAQVVPAIGLATSGLGGIQNLLGFFK